VTLKPDSNAPEVLRRMTLVPGVSHFSEAWKSPLSMEDMEQNAWALAQNREFASFRVDTRRGDKVFPHTSC
jgi:adenylyl- and sulfurtransferase ThiI